MSENKGDLISREALKTELEEVYRHTRNYLSDEDEAQNSLLDNILEDIDNMPTVEPERPQGKWITTRTMIHDGNPYCTVCDEENIIRSKFCPNCGADMRKGGAKCD